MTRQAWLCINRHKNSGKFKIRKLIAKEIKATDSFQYKRKNV